MAKMHDREHRIPDGTRYESFDRHWDDDGVLAAFSLWVREDDEDARELRSRMNRVLKRWIDARERRSIKN